jgi:hypothetical protein
LVPKGFGTFLTNLCDFEVFASWDAQTHQKFWPSKSWASNYFQTSGRKSLCKAGPSLQRQPTVALFVFHWLKTSDLTQKKYLAGRFAWPTQPCPVSAKRLKAPTPWGEVRGAVPMSIA